MIRKAVVIFFFSVAFFTSRAQDEMAAKAVELMDEEKFGEALVILDKLVKDYPTVTMYRYNRAVCAFSLENYRLAIADYQYLLRQLPEAEYAFQIANAYEQMDSLALAAGYYGKSIEIDAENYLTFFKRGTVFLKMNELSSAIRDFDAALSLNPKHHNSLHNRGIALYKSKKPEKACADWCEASSLGNTVSGQHITQNCRPLSLTCAK